MNKILIKNNFSQKKKKKRGVRRVEEGEEG